VAPSKLHVDELERLRNELALRDATIAAERAKNEALEMRMQLKAREDEIAKLRAEIAGSATTSDRTMTKTSTGAIAPVIGTTKQPVVAQTKAPSESNGQRPVVGSASKRAAGTSNKRPSTNAEKQQHVVKKTTNKRKQEAAPLEVVEDPGTESMHQKTKFRKTTNVVRAKDSSLIRVRIPGIMFCNRCKRTNVPPDNAAFDPEYPGTCLPCKERIKVLTELNKGVSKSPKKILQHNELMLIAAQEGQVDVLEYLYEHDCDFSVEDANTCLELAKIRKPRAGNYDKSCCVH
jgi:hypothetical protein